MAFLPSSPTFHHQCCLWYGGTPQNKPTTQFPWWYQLKYLLLTPRFIDQRVFNVLNIKHSIGRLMTMKLASSTALSTWRRKACHFNKANWRPTNPPRVTPPQATSPFWLVVESLSSFLLWCFSWPLVGQLCHQNEACITKRKKRNASILFPAVPPSWMAAN